MSWWGEALDVNVEEQFGDKEIESQSLALFKTGDNWARGRNQLFWHISKIPL